MLICGIAVHDRYMHEVGSKLQKGILNIKKRYGVSILKVNVFCGGERQTIKEIERLEKMKHRQINLNLNAGK